MRLTALGLCPPRELDRPRLRRVLAAEADRPALKRLVLLLLVAAGGLFAVAAATSKLYRIPSSAMEPTLHCPRPGGGCRGDEADRIAVSRVLYRVLDPRRGDIVAYKIPAAGARQCGSEPGNIFVHRIVGLPGERWRTAGGFVYIDGKRLAEPYVKPDRRDLQRLPERRIPKGRYLLLGDSRPSSCDSRVWGYVPRKAFIGPKIATYWPLERISIR